MICNIKKDGGANRISRWIEMPKMEKALKINIDTVPKVCFS